MWTATLQGGHDSAVYTCTCTINPLHITGIAIKLLLEEHLSFSSLTFVTEVQTLGLQVFVWRHFNMNRLEFGPSAMQKYCTRTKCMYTCFLLPN